MALGVAPPVNTNRKCISALKHPPFNISRPSLVENLRLHSDSVVSFVHACKSGVSLHNLRSLRLGGSIGDAEMVDLSRAIATESLRALTELDLEFNQIGDLGMIEFSRSIANGSLRALTTLFLNDNQIGDAGMIEFSRSITNGSMGALTSLWLSNNNIGDQGMIAFSNAIASGSWPKCTMIVVSGNPGNAAPLKSACEERGIACF